MNTYKITTEDRVQMKAHALSFADARADFKAAMPGVGLAHIKITRYGRVD